ncbi:MAG: response regulator [Planctomycetota bacterium]|nr:MAG: response regulator [Planctomycetota bacterium]
MPIRTWSSTAQPRVRRLTIVALILTACCAAPAASLAAFASARGDDFAAYITRALLNAASASLAICAAVLVLMYHRFARERATLLIALGLIAAGAVHVAYRIPAQYMLMFKERTDHWIPSAGALEYFLFGAALLAAVCVPECKRHARRRRRSRALWLPASILVAASTPLAAFLLSTVGDFARRPQLDDWHSSRLAELLAAGMYVAAVGVILVKGAAVRRPRLSNWLAYTATTLAAAQLTIAVASRDQYDAGYLIGRALHVSGFALLLTGLARQMSRLLRAARARGAALRRMNLALRQSFDELTTQKAALDEHSIVEITDPQGRIQYVNRCSCRITGYDADDLLGKTHRAVSSGLHPPEFFENLWNTIQSGRVWRGEICNRRKDGVLYWVDTTIMPVRDEHGRIVRYVAIRTDVTALKLAEQRERLARQRLESALRRAEREIAARAKLDEIIQLSFTVSDVNELLRRSLDILLDTPFIEVLAKGVVFRTNPDSHALEFVAARGAATELRTLCAHVQPGQCLCGRAAQSGKILFADCVDERHEIRFPGMEPHGHYNVPIMSDGVCHGVIALYLKHGAQRREEDVAFLASAADVLAAVMERLQAAEALRRTNARLNESLARERAVVSQLNQALAAAESATRAKSEFLANMSHELRTPLTAILGFAEELRRDEEHALSPAQHDAAVATIHRNGRLLLEIIDDILDLTKIERGELTTTRREIDLPALVREVLAPMRTRAEEKQLDLRARLLTSIPHKIRTDPRRLCQILFNLIGNAIKFTQRGSVTLEVSLERDAGVGPKMRFDVVDTGIGIAPEEKARLFQAFTQADQSTSRAFGGIGLGLTLCQHLTTQLGGAIDVSSEPGVGSRFTVTVDPGPLDDVEMTDTLDDANGEAESATPSPSKAQTKPRLDGLNILLVEDGPDNQRLISFLLRKAGAQVALAGDGAQALEVIGVTSNAPRRFDVILMDMSMPVMDGYTATRRLRDAGYDAPIIALTAHALAGDREKCLAAGCDDYLTKPIVRAKLLETIRQWSARRSRPTSANA